MDRDGSSRPITLEDILIIAPYNAQVFEIQRRLPNARVGTVDKFQGQEAAIVIYSVTTSSHADAPRGMEFLYSLNRLNVAVSRAKCVCVLVAVASDLRARLHDAAPDGIGQRLLSLSRARPAAGRLGLSVSATRGASGIHRRVRLRSRSTYSACPRIRPRAGERWAAIANFLYKLDTYPCRPESPAGQLAAASDPLNNHEPGESLWISTN